MQRVFKYENLTLRFTGHHMFPMSGIHTAENGSITFTGISGYMFSLLKRALRFKHVIKLPPEYNWGGRKADGTWGGQFGMVVRNECDILVGPVTPTADRVSALQPLPQYFYADACHCGGRTERYVTDVFGYVNAFDREVWLGVFTAMLVVGLALALVENNFRCSGLARAVYFAVLELFSIFLMEASPRVTHGSVKRSLIGVWWLTAFVMASAFTGHMKASLTQRDEAPRMDRIADVVAKRHVAPVIIRGTTYEEVFKNTHDRTQQQLWAVVKRMRSVLPARQVFTREIFDDVLAGKKVIFLEPTLFFHAVSTLYKEAPQGEFYLAREKVAFFMMGMFVNRDLDPDLRKALHVRSRWIIESGMPEKFRLDTIEKSRPRSSDDGRFQQMSIDDMSGLFYLHLAGVGVATGALIAERLVCCFARICCHRNSRSANHVTAT
ncbi:probable glutamate receptor [Ornithodoros turicata]|uniref:probable glutamate receptor n=1 Tax=Ornithodoros turicata TaxID=34597 RepID=UPI00313933F6